MKLSTTIKFEPRDLWIGIFWDLKDNILFVYLCLVPCLPIIFKVEE